MKLPIMLFGFSDAYDNKKKHFDIFDSFNLLG